MSQFNLFDTFSDKLKISVPNPIPLYLSVEELDYRSYPELFFNFSFYGYSCWIKKYYTRYVLNLRGFTGLNLDDNVKFYNPHSTTRIHFKSLDTCISYFRVYVHSIIDSCLCGVLRTPINSSDNLSEFALKQRSRIVSRVFKLDQKLLTFGSSYDYNLELF